MLIQFKVKNFLSFKDEAIIDLRAVASDQSMPSNLIEKEYRNKPIKMLKSAALYGANASGKTNFIYAMTLFKDFICRNDGGYHQHNVNGR